MIDETIETALAKIGLPVYYRVYRGPGVIAPPHIFWFIDREEFGGSDGNCCKTVTKTVILYLTTIDKSPDLEKAIEREFRGICDRIEKSESYNDKDDVFEVVYMLTITQKG